jgi:CelD/BcsL family acetyltransferase involved in cellulose biosynthesis
VTDLVVASVTTAEGLAALAPSWRRLESEATTVLPFATHEWATTWWEHFSEDRLSLRDSLAVRTVRGTDGELVAVAPLMLTERPRSGPARFRVVQFFGADPNLTEVRGMLVRTGEEVPALEAILADVMSARWDWVEWAGTVAGSPSAAALSRLPQLSRCREVPNFVLPLEKSWDAQRSKLRRNVKEAVRKSYNAPRRDGHDLRFEVARSRADVTAALQVFFRLHAKRARASATAVHRDVFSSAVTRDFLVDVCRRLADRGATRIFQLKAGDDVVATRVGFAVGGSLYLYYSGFEPDWGKYSVATRVVVEAIKSAIDEGLTAVNLSTGTDVSKTRWDPVEVIYREVRLHSVGTRAHLAARTHELAGRLVENEGTHRVFRRLLARRDGL